MRVSFLPKPYNVFQREAAKADIKAFVHYPPAIGIVFGTVLEFSDDFMPRFNGKNFPQHPESLLLMYSALKASVESLQNPLFGDSSAILIGLPKQPFCTFTQK